MAAGLRLGDAPPAAPDDHDDFPLVVQLLGFRRAQNGLQVPGEGFPGAHENAGMGRRGSGVLVLLVAVAVVDADADDLLRIRHRRQPSDVLQLMGGSGLRSQPPRRIDFASPQQRLQAANVRHQSAEIDHSAIHHRAETAALPVPVGQQPHARIIGPSPRMERLTLSLILSKLGDCDLRFPLSLG